MVVDGATLAVAMTTKRKKQKLVVHIKVFYIIEVLKRWKDLGGNLSETTRPTSNVLEDSRDTTQYI